MRSVRLHTFPHARKGLVGIAKPIVKRDNINVIRANLQIDLGHPAFAHSLFQRLHQQPPDSCFALFRGHGEMVNPSSRAVIRTHDRIPVNGNQEQ